MKKSIAIIIYIIFFLIFIELVSIAINLPPEFITIEVNEESAYMNSENNVLSYEFKPNYRNDNPDNHETFSYTNSFGQRDIERNLTKSKYRVILIGDSVVAGHGLEFEDTITNQFDTNYSAKFEVLNFGVGGYNTKSQIELLNTIGAQFNPDMVIMINTYNDAEKINGQAGKYGLPLIGDLNMKSRFLRHLAFRFNWWNVKTNNMGIPEFSDKEYVDLFRDVNEDYHFVLVHWPEYPSSNRKELLQNISKEFNFDFITLDGIITSEHLTDGIHPNKGGAKITATILQEYIITKIP